MAKLQAAVDLGRLGGQSRSPKKAAAARKNAIKATAARRKGKRKLAKEQE